MENLCYTLKKDICALPGSVTGKYSYIKTCNQKEVFKGECFDLKKLIEDLGDTSSKTVGRTKCGRDEIDDRMESLSSNPFDTPTK